MDKRLRDHLRRLGKKGGTAAAGAGGRKRWADVPPEQRSAMMRKVSRAKQQKKRT